MAILRDDPASCRSQSGFWKNRRVLKSGAWKDPETPD